MEPVKLLRLIEGVADGGARGAAVAGGIAGQRGPVTGRRVRPALDFEIGAEPTGETYLQMIAGLLRSGDAQLRGFVRADVGTVAAGGVGHIGVVVPELAALVGRQAE